MNNCTDQKKLSVDIAYIGTESSVDLITLITKNFPDNEQAERSNTLKQNASVTLNNIVDDVRLQMHIEALNQLHKIEPYFKQITRAENQFVILCFDANGNVNLPTIEHQLKVLKQIENDIKTKKPSATFILVALGSQSTPQVVMNLNSLKKNAGFDEKTSLLTAAPADKPETAKNIITNITHIMSDRLKKLKEEKNTLSQYDLVVKTINAYIDVHSKKVKNKVNGPIVSEKRYKNFFESRQDYKFYSSLEYSSASLHHGKDGYERVKTLQGKIKSSESDDSKLQIINEFKALLNQSSKTVFSLKHIWTIAQLEQAKDLSSENLILHIKQNRDEQYSPSKLEFKI